MSPTSRSRCAVAPDSRSFGPCRSNSSPSALPERSDASRTSRARRSRSSAPPCEQFTRAQSMPAATRRSSTPGASVAGPSVARIFVRRCVITPRRLASPSTRQPAPLERPPQLDEVGAGRAGWRRSPPRSGAAGGAACSGARAARARSSSMRISWSNQARSVVVELGAEPAERGERLEVARGERVAERLVGEDRRADREVGERERALLPERERGLQRAAGERERRRQRPPAAPAARARRRRPAIGRRARARRCRRGRGRARSRARRRRPARAPTRCDSAPPAARARNGDVRRGRGRARTWRSRGAARRRRACRSAARARTRRGAAAPRAPARARPRGGRRPTTSITASAHSHSVSENASTLRDVGAALARQLAEARPDRADRDPVGVQDGVDRQALLGALAADRGGVLELGRRVGGRRSRSAVSARLTLPRIARASVSAGSAAEVRDLLADAVADAVDERVELGLDLGDELPTTRAAAAVARWAATGASPPTPALRGVGRRAARRGRRASAARRAATSAKAASWTASRMPPASASPKTRMPPMMQVRFAAVEVQAMTGTASPSWKPRAEARKASAEASGGDGQPGREDEREQAVAGGAGERLERDVARRRTARRRRRRAARRGDGRARRAAARRSAACRAASVAGLEGDQAGRRRTPRAGRRAPAA